MDLFIVNRHEGDQEKVEETNEQDNIERIMKRIEKRKQARMKQKQKLAQKQDFTITKTHERRQQKREIKAKLSKPELASTQESDEFIDKTIEENIKDVAVNLNNLQQVDKTNLGGSKTEHFTVLGSEQFDKKSKVRRVLPKWLTTPTIISVNLQDLNMKVSKLKELDKDLRKKLKENNIKFFFPVQAEVIPWLIQANSHSNLIFPQDVCVSAPTGSGKTLAYVLPIIQALKSYNMKQIRALIILPTQDLALQVFDTFKKYTTGTHIKACLVTGKNSFEMEQKQLVTENPAFGYLNKMDILVCTAGKLVDHLKETRGFNLQYLKFLVIDEADRVLDNVQNDWLYHLEKHLYENDEYIQNLKVLNLFTLQQRRPPQKLLFSATLSQDPEKLQKLSLFQPKLFTSVIESEKIEKQINTETFIGKYTTPKELTEKYIECSLELKPLVLYTFIKEQKLTKTIIFTNTLETTHRLAILLQSLFKDQLKIIEISSQLQPKTRVNLMRNFSDGNIDVIVCTDSLARGMDLPGVQCVISYSVPKYIKTYIHRAGRTARAGEKGLAVTVLNKTQLTSFLNLLQQAGKDCLEQIKIPEDDLEVLSEQYKGALHELKDIVAKEEEDKVNKIKSAKGMYKKRKLAN